jgi:hypothetical protein
MFIIGGYPTLELYTYPMYLVDENDGAPDPTSLSPIATVERVERSHYDRVSED